METYKRYAESPLYLEDSEPTSCVNGSGESTLIP